MAHFIYSQAENILSKLNDCPTYQRRMEYTILSLKEILLDAEEKQEQDCVLRDWLKELQNVFYQIEDSIEEFKWEFFKQEGIGKQVRAPFLCADRISVHKSEPTRKMKKLCDNLDSVAAKMYEFHLTEKHTASIRMETTHSFLSAAEISTRHMKPSWQLLYPLTDDPKAYHENRYKKILDDFKNYSRGLFLIVGGAGIGKSTLAKFIYNDQEIVAHYTSRFWVCVQEGFDPQRLLREVYSFADDKEICDDLTMKHLLFKVKRFLQGRNFLLVFQDLSDTNLEVYSMFESLMEMGNHRSKIIVTTQSEKIANELSKKYLVADQNIFKLDGLSERNSFSLFKDYAFRDTVQNAEFTKIAEQIVKKCKGVPLAIKCLGSLLSSKTRISEWKNVKDKLWALKEEDDSTFPILRLCYNLMPSHLKHCFLHCSRLPNDRILSSNDVIQLWMAHGLLHSPEENNLSLETIGEKYFMELYSKCFVQEIEDHGLGYWFKLHPLIQKLAHVLTQEQAESSVGTKPVTEIRSLAFQVRNRVPPSASLAEKCISKFKCLRLLYLGNTNLQEIPNAIGTLKNLRYLDLHGNRKIKRLPKSICDLQSLQTLILASCSELEELPNDIRNLVSLRYLWVTTNKLHLHKNGVGTMTSLRYLAIGGCDNLQNLFDRPECLEGLETLMISDCKTLKSLPNEMRFLKSLKNLAIWNCKQLKLTLKEVEFRLQRFTIRELPKVDELPEWLEGSTETLRILQIINCPITMDDETFDSYEAVERTIIFGSVKVEQAIPGYGFEHRNLTVRGAAVDFEMNRHSYY